RAPCVASTSKSRNLHRRAKPRSGSARRIQLLERHAGNPAQHVRKGDVEVLNASSLTPQASGNAQIPNSTSVLREHHRSAPVLAAIYTHLGVGTRSSSVRSAVSIAPAHADPVKLRRSGMDGEDIAPSR